MKYTVEPQVVAGCECEDCRAGRHIYALQRWQDGKWIVAGVSLQSYASADECKRNHRWGIEFCADDVWEDGTQVMPPEHMQTPASACGHKVMLDTAALQKSAERLKLHWLQ